MKYSKVLMDYMDDLSNKYYSGKLSEDKLLRLADKLVQWETIAYRRKIK